ncbi:MAG: hypothetical protein DRJ69_07170 [Thermoprotei archaeon]|nr:MAG: hypothetical protein DRJ69_07170 [Thermoprotei archaeon]
MALAWEIVKKNKPLAKAVILRVVSERRKYLLQQLEFLNERIRAFEEKHGASLDEFEARLGDSPGEHATWFEWKSLVELRRAVEEELNELEEAYRRVAEEIY